MKSQLNRSPLKTENFVRYEFKYFLSIDARERIESEVDNFTGDPLQDGFLGWTQQQVAYDFS